MNVEKLVFSKLFKEELAVSKVELGLIDDAKKGIDMVKKAYKDSIWNELEKLPNTVADVVQRASAALKMAGEGQGIAIKNARKVSEMAKELGIANPKEIQAIFDDNDYDVLYNALSDDIAKIISAAKK